MDSSFSLVGGENFRAVLDRQQAERDEDISRREAVQKRRRDSDRTKREEEAEREDELGRLQKVCHHTPHQYRQ